MCSKKIGLDIKVNYDDSQLPAWIKSMSNSQLKASMAARKQWLDSHKKGDMANFGGQMKTYEQIANELAMMQARGTNVENKPKKSQKELDKEKKAKEKAAKAAEKARNEAETQAGNRRKAEEDYTKTISSYSEKAEETMTKNRIAAMKDGYEKEIAQIKENSEKEIKAVEDGEAPKEGNVLKMAPHPQHDLLRSEWDRPYTREQAAYPLLWLREKKFWPSVARVDDAYGDTNLFCTCAPVEDYE